MPINPALVMTLPDDNKFEFSDSSTYFPSFPPSCSRSAGATRVPINSVARISFSWGNEAGFIIKVIREMPPSA
ncbi:MAG: hypothetical protein ACRD8Z_13350, partial [Nitrososphaeraceae archaeon]